MTIDNFSLKEAKVDAINYLAKKYNTLEYHSGLVDLLNSVYPNYSFHELSKHEMHKILNRTLLHFYNGEQIHKYQLFKLYQSKSNLVGAFEIKVNNSRLDFLTINGVTTSFEIKSELDNLSKLNKQISDYSLAFEYNNIVVAERHLEKITALAPSSFGLWSYNMGEYNVVRKAELNRKIEPKVQLSQLTKAELLHSFPEHRGSIPNILSNLTAQKINSQFKKVLKERYTNRWRFLTNHCDDILPIDLQFFFNTNVNPKHVYQTI